MKQTLVAKLKLHATPEQCKTLRATQLAYRDALNFVSQYAFAHGKMSNKVRLQEGTYREIRARYQIPAQMACSIPRQVGATYKALWRSVKRNVALRKAGKTKKRYEGLDQPPKYVSPTLTYQLGHDYGFKTDHRVSILTLEGRVILPYTGYNKHVALIEHEASIGAAQLYYDKPKKQFYLLVSLTVSVADPTPETQTSVVGVDVGMRVEQHPHSLIGLEDLTGVRERTKHKRGGKATKKQRKAHAKQSKWSFAELHGMIAYKSARQASMSVKIDAHYTSQACPICGHACRGNRPDNGLLFICQHCHYTLHSDLVGARNVTLRTLLIRQDWMSTGRLSIAPDVSSDEAKAERLKRYSELRWSLDTSSAL